MQSYKETLNLPKTKFSMKANLPQREPEMLKFWEKIDLYKKMQDIRIDGKKFILNDGPPYANGDIHLGHALNKILKDIIIKSKTISGFKVPFIPGWDCHGLPIELNVEKKFGKAGEKLTEHEFRAKCREYADQQIDRQKIGFKRLGVVGDWDNPYKTMEFQFQANVIRALAKIIENGHLHKGEKPVHWCVSCGSALAEAEVEYKDKQSPSIYVLFKVKDPKSFLNCFLQKNDDKKINQQDVKTTKTLKVDNSKLDEKLNKELSKELNKEIDDLDKLEKKDIFVVIWTTTPWSLPANEAVALEDDIDYVLVEVNEHCIKDNNINYGKEKNCRKLLFLAKELLESVMERSNISDYKVLAESKGKKFELQKLHHPFYEREVPIILAPHVTLDAGTGCVHTAPAHGQDDYIIGQKYKLNMHNPVLDNGCFSKETKYFANMHVYKANDEVLKVLSENFRLLSSEIISHSYPHCWRHKTPLIFRATPQWFIGMDQKGLRDLALKFVKEKVSWIPSWGMARMEAMIKNRPDWCISRQRTWGVPMAIFVHKETKNLHPNIVELMYKVADRVSQSGIDAWYELDKKELLKDDENEYEKAKDTLDVWFESGGVHFGVLDEHKELHSPADLYLEGSDQYRGWFQTSLLSSIAMKNVAPYKQVLTHGFTVDSKGHKMSKSLGNVIVPDKVMKTLGADILRLWVAASDYSQDLHVSDEILKRISEGYRRIRNTARFLLSNLNEFDPKSDLVDPKNMIVLDRWIVDRTRKLQDLIIAEYDNYNFHIIYQQIHNFCVNELGSFYLDVIKDRQYTCKKDGLPRKSCQTAMYHIIEALVVWLAPILSFTAEEIWQNMSVKAIGEREESVFLTNWYDGLFEIAKDEKMNDLFWEEVLEIRDLVNKVLEEKRQNGVIGSALEANVALFCDDDLFTKLSFLKDELRFVLITSKADIFKMKDLQDFGSIGFQERANETKKSLELNGNNDEGFFDFSLEKVDKINKKLSIYVEKATFSKCERCWHRRFDVNKNEKYPNICNRCIENIVTEKGENRFFA